MKERFYRVEMIQHEEDYVMIKAKGKNKAEEKAMIANPNYDEYEAIEISEEEYMEEQQC